MIASWYEGRTSSATLSFARGEASGVDQDMRIKSRLMALTLTREHAGTESHRANGSCADLDNRALCALFPSRAGYQYDTWTCFASSA